MATELKVQASKVQYTCNSVCDKFDIKFPQITVLQRENVEYKKKVASLEDDIHSLKKSHDTLTSLLL